LSELGRLLVTLGALLLVMGGVVLLLSKAGLPFGRLPGDFSFRGKGVQVFFPLGSSILLSIVLSLVFYLLGRWRR
jgi:ribose/xylose/arabinose/galactoside ABC-type transport system permease subunit